MEQAYEHGGTAELGDNGRCLGFPHAKIGSLVVALCGAQLLALGFFHGLFSQFPTWTTKQKVSKPVMPFLSSAQLQNAIRLDPCIHDPLCHGYRWCINDESALAQLVAWTMQGHYQHAEKVLASLNFGPLPARPTFQQQAVARLTLPTGLGKNEPARWHRDGLVFQHIAWLAAVIEGGGNIATQMPHLRPADKGFDSLLIPLTSQREALNGLFICEEKATEHPRQQIRDEVWPSILALEAGSRDAELNGHIMAILREYQVQNIAAVAADLHWLGRKSYRVSITISPIQDGEARRSALFDDYNNTAPGHINRRRAETLALPNLRDWMDTFCGRVITAIATA